VNEQRLYKLPAMFVLDHEERRPCDQPEQMAVLQEVRGCVAHVLANEQQLENLRGDAEFYAQGNVDDCQSLVRSAKATLAAIERQRQRGPSNTSRREVN
jgi:hypothetical protein